MTQADRERRREPFRRGLGSPALFAIVYTSVASAVYFSLGVVAEHALGLTPLVFLAAGVFFVLAAMTYVEGASLHQDRAGSTVFARFAFNELVSFVAGWAILLDYIILIAVTALSATHYLAAFWSPLGDEDELELLVAIGDHPVRRGAQRARLLEDARQPDRGARRRGPRAAGAAHRPRSRGLLRPRRAAGPDRPRDQPRRGARSSSRWAWPPSCSRASSRRPACRARWPSGAAGLKRLMTAATATVMTVYVGIALVAMTALPVGRQRHVAGAQLPRGARARDRRPASTRTGCADGLTYVVAAAAAVTLIAAANSAMLGLSRLAYSLATNRQIPSCDRAPAPDALDAVRGHRASPRCWPRRSWLPLDLEFLVGIFAFGALLGLTIAHLSIVVLRVPRARRGRGRTRCRST